MGVDERREGATNGGWDSFSERLTSALVGAMKDGDDERDGLEAAETGVPPDRDASDVDRQWRSDGGDQGVAGATPATSGPDPFGELDNWAPEAARPGAPGGDTGVPPAYDEPWIGDTGSPPAYNDPWTGDSHNPSGYGAAWVGDADVPITEDDEWLDDIDLEPADDQWEEEDLAASLSSRMLGFTPGHGASPPPAHRRQRTERTERWREGATAWWVDHWRVVGSVAAAVLVMALLVALATRGGGHRASTAGRVAVSDSTTTPTTLATDAAGTSGAAGVPPSQPATTDTSVPAGAADPGNQGGGSSGPVGGSFGGTGRTSSLASGSNTGSHTGSNTGSNTGVSPSPAGTSDTTATPATTPATVPRTTTSNVPRTPPSYTVPSITFPTFTIPHRTTTTRP